MTKSENEAESSTREVVVEYDIDKFDPFHAVAYGDPTGVGLAVVREALKERAEAGWELVKSHVLADSVSVSGRSSESTDFLFLIWRRERKTHG